MSRVKAGETGYNPSGATGPFFQLIKEHHKPREVDLSDCRKLPHEGAESLRARRRVDSEGISSVLTSLGRRKSFKGSAAVSADRKGLIELLNLSGPLLCRVRLSMRTGYGLGLTF